MNRVRASKADIVLMPYNYVLDRQIRRVLEIDLKGDVLIIDEAHNLPQVIEDTSSFKLTTDTFIRVLKELNDVEEAMRIVQKSKD